MPGDTGDTVALEYASYDLSHIAIQIFTKVVYQIQVSVYPVLDKDATYISDDIAYSVSLLTKNGITVTRIVDNDCKTVTLDKQQ